MSRRTPPPSPRRGGRRSSRRSRATTATRARRRARPRGRSAREGRAHSAGGRRRRSRTSVGLPPEVDPPSAGIRPARQSTSGTIRPSPRSPRDRSATCAASPSVGASTITRTSDSVPLGRISTLPATREPLLGLPDLVGHERRHPVDRGNRHVDEDLREPRHHARQIGERSSRALHEVEDLQAGEHSVTRRCEVVEDDVPALLATEAQAAARRAPRARSGRRPVSPGSRCLRRASRSAARGCSSP